jgi:hypothetical protein
MLARAAQVRKCLDPMLPTNTGVTLTATISRRRFLTRGSLAACAGLAPAWATAAAPDPFTASRFQAMVGTDFSARSLSSDPFALASSSTPASTAALKLRLRKVGPLAQGRPYDVRDAERSFVLTFDVDGATAGQHTYALPHDRVGPCAALRVPSRDGRTLNAIFNRSV